MTVKLPTTPPQVAEQAAQAETSRSSRGAVRVLIVDDDVDLAELLAEALAHAGFHTRVAFASHEAIEVCTTFHPHAAILDVGLPDLDGYELAKRLRDRYGRIFLVAATGYGQPSDRERAAVAGFDQHLVKPVRLRDLVATLDEHVVHAAAPDTGVDAAAILTR